MKAEKMPIDIPSTESVIISGPDDEDVGDARHQQQI